jgi:DNA sulfur modification protein DndD
VSGILFHRLSLLNFMPYEGQHHIELGTRAPITIVYGENMWGKTTLLNAVRWVWYGTALDRFGSPIPRVKIVNWEAAELGEFVAEVELEFSVENVPHTVTRKIQASDTSRAPRQDSDFEELLFLVRDQVTLPQSEAQPSLNQLLNEHVSHFFFFDSEQLGRYEQLLLDPKQQANTIKQYIEAVLGVPALENAVSDLIAGQKDAGKRQSALAKRNEAAQMAAHQADRAQTLLDNRGNETSILEAKKRELQSRLGQIEAELAGMGDAEADIKERRILSDQILQLNRQIDSNEEERRELLQSAWLDLVHPRVRELGEQLEARRAEEVANANRAAVLRKTVSELESFLDSGLCPTCGQAHPEAELRRHRDTLRQTKEALQAVVVDEGSQGGLSEQITMVNRLRPAGVEKAISANESEFRRLRLSLVDAERKRDAIDARLENHDEARIAGNREAANDLNKQLGLIETKIDEYGRDIARLESELAQHRATIAGVGGPELERINAEVRLFDHLIRAFRGGVELLRDQLKAQIERDATEVFLQLTTEEKYTGLRINDQYGLTILGTGGAEVPARSAGAEQIVALSLVSALNKNAVRKAPVIMDMPFGRLDRSHRQNILKFAPSMGEQLVLLVHSGEIDREVDVAPIMRNVDREFRVERISEKQSRIQPLDES